MAKSKTVFVCDNCGADYPKWVGKCSSCGAWDSLKEFKPSKAKGRTAGAPTEMKELKQIDRKKTERLDSGLNELDLVLGGGLVPASILLFGGEPGIGKSTLLLQLAGALAEKDILALYFSGEESAEQLAMRADRLGIDSGSLQIASEANVDQMESIVNQVKPALVIVDSIQTAYVDSGENLPGSIGQVRACANQLLRLAKEAGVTIILVGHITKDGYLAGPKMLEHLVDTVLYLEGDRQHQFRLLRAVKNRFGATNEIGVYEMSGSGLQPVVNPSELFLDPNRRNVSGSVIVSDMEGNRTFFLEVQALVSPAAYGNPQRNVTGFDLRRLQMLLAVIERRAGLRVGTQDVFVNAVGGLKLDEPAADLGVIAAVVSSMKDKAVQSEMLILGEVGLGGEVRGVQRIRRRLEEAVRLGFQHVVLPASDVKHGKDLELDLIPVNSVLEMVDKIF